MPICSTRPRAPQVNAAGQVVVGTGDDLNGIVIAGQNSQFGRGIYGTDKNNIQPRVGMSWDLFSDGRTVLRSAYGVYYDQVLTGHLPAERVRQSAVRGQPHDPESAAVESRRRGRRRPRRRRRR